MQQIRFALFAPSDIQRHVGTAPDNRWGPQTRRAVALALGLPADSSDADIQRHVGVTVDGVIGPRSVNAIAEKLGMILVTAARQAGVADGPIPAGYFEMLARIESGTRPYVKAPTSSASGFYQFIRATWIGEGGKWGGDMSQAFGGLRPSVEEQRGRATSFTLKNVNYLRQRGIPINSATLYAAHFFGPVTAAKVLQANDSARADLLAGAAATNANQSILRGKTVRQFKDWLRRKTGAQA